MSQFNYMGVSPWSNPAGAVKKQTNELPAKQKAATTTEKVDDAEETKEAPVKKLLRRAKKNNK